MEAAAVLLVLWVLAVPIGCLIAATRALRRAERAENELLALHRAVGNLRADLQQLERTRVASRVAEPTIEAASAEPARPAETAAVGPELREPWTREAPPPPALAPPVAAPGPRAEPQPAKAEAVPVIEPPGVPTPHRPKVDWERFMGVKLFAWVGGFALFLAVAFFVKYSFDNNLISREVRVATGFLVGLALVAGGVVLKRKAYAATAQTLCGTGIVILYAVSFACYARYRFTGYEFTFGLMVLVTVTAFLLAVRMPAQVVAVLGLVGGFLTPPLMGGEVDRPLGLFGYVAILDAGLVAVALAQRWHHLVGLAVVGTAALQIGWAARFFEPRKAFIALGILVVFNVLFLAAWWAGNRIGQRSRWLERSALVPPLLTFLFSFHVLSQAELGGRPGVVFLFLLAADLPVLALALRHPPLQRAHAVAGALAFLALAVWLADRVDTAMLGWALGGILGFAALHTVFPLVIERVRPGAAPVWLGHLFPAAALVLMLVPLLRELSVPWAMWPTVALIDALAIGLALASGAVTGVLAVLVLTLVVVGFWIGQVPADPNPQWLALGLVGGFALFFHAASLLTSRRIPARAAPGGNEDGEGPRPAIPGWLQLPGSEELQRAHLPMLSAALPFLLLIQIATRLPVGNPSALYGLALLLVVLLLGLARQLRLAALVPVALACVLALELSWHQARFNRAEALAPLIWNIGFAALFIAYPFLFRQVFAGSLLPWAAAALAGPLHFFLVYRVVKAAYPNAFMGALPSAFAVPMLLALASVARAWAGGAPNRTQLLAWFGGSALFFITLIFPVQFEKQWITLGWALEGVALLWLFHRVPHGGLRATGSVLLMVAFVRLALNPAVLSYHSRTGTPILNWFLYAYGVTTLSLLAGARLLAPRDRVFGVKVQPVLYTLGTVLAFLLVNIQIADYFSTGETLTFEFSGSFARDMTYSIAWGLFALGLLVIGVVKAQPAVRYASVALLGVTIVKLFLHDLVRLSALYRIGAFLGVAVISILASVLYQRFFAGLAHRASESPDAAKATRSA
jgi:uncharacterized membrane protein